MKKIWFLFIASFVLVGCESLLDDATIYDYSIEQRMDCFCPQVGVWVKLLIKADTVATAIRSSDEHRLGYDEFKSYKSIKDLFELINATDTTINYLNYTIDSVNNYPSYIFINPKPIIINDTTIIIIEDADLSYTTKNYTKFE